MEDGVHQFLALAFPLFGLLALLFGLGRLWAGAHWILVGVNVEQGQLEQTQYGHNHILDLKLTHRINWVPLPRWEWIELILTTIIVLFRMIE